jgi:hypothetical protein
MNQPYIPVTVDGRRIGSVRVEDDNSVSWRVGPSPAKWHPADTVVAAYRAATDHYLSSQERAVTRGPRLVVTQPMGHVR